MKQQGGASPIWHLGCNSKRIRPDWGEPEICPRIVHAAFEVRHGARTAEHRERTVEVALGPKGALENGNIGALTRRVPTGGVVRAMPLSRGKPKLPKEPRPARVVELLRKDIETKACVRMQMAFYFIGWVIR